MSKYIRYFFRAIAVTKIIMVTLPKVLADGKISVEEMVSFFIDVCDACGWKTYIEVPDGLDFPDFPISIDKG